LAAHKSFSTSERLAPLAIISSVRFSAANRDSACDGVVVFGPCLDSDPAGCTTLAAALSCISWVGWRRDSGAHISIGRPRPIMSDGNPGLQKQCPLFNKKPGNC